MKSRRTTIKYLIFAFGLLFIVAGLYFYRAVNSDGVAKEGYIYIPTGSVFKNVVEALGEDGGYLKNTDRFVSVAKLVNADKTVKPGRYKLSHGMSYLDVARMFSRGFQTPVRVTFNNIRTLPQLAGRLAPQIEPDSIDIVTLLMADTTASKYGFDDRTFIGMFIPDTYEVYWNITAAGFIDRMHREYEKFWTDDRRAKADKLGLSANQISTLASIVYEETKMSDEMPTVAGVYINRLRKGMLLQADPTVKYAVGDFALRRVLNRHLETDSPYNTYKYAGLPPGPICMPSITAIDAVLNYAHHDYYYFCAKEDFSGYHNFARTLAEHNVNRQKYVSALNRLGIR